MWKLEKKYVYYLGIAFLIFVCFIVLRLFSPEDTWICSNGQWVKHGNPATSQPINKCP